ncbi:hypothetical protein Q8A73_006337 [Channa argus]|nr:hypothetical protein Q8A73_006337 [Channa argus]
MLSLAPETLPKSSKSSKALATHSSLSSNNVVSSAYCESFTRKSPPPGTRVPLTLASALMAAARGSMYRTNNSGERGQPCLTPSLTSNSLPILHFTITTLRAPVYKDRSHPTEMLPFTSNTTEMLLLQDTAIQLPVAWPKMRTIYKTLKD